tara:strand:+ start:187 stop:354 length:168 start_codon:yes stop_codon:yes gene_type:complete
MTITYQLANFEEKLVAIQRKIDGVFDASIPIDESNTDYQEYLAWVKAGNTPEAAE